MGEIFNGGMPELKKDEFEKKLGFFFTTISSLKGVGEKIFDGFCRLLPNTRYKDLLFHFPVSVVDRSYMPTLMTVEVGRVATLNVEVMKHTPPPYVKKGKNIIIFIFIFKNA